MVDYGSTACPGGRFYEAYSYTPSGRVTKKKLLWLYSGRPDIEVEGLWTYDNEGRIATRRFPSDNIPERYFYDGMGRLNRVETDIYDNYSEAWVPYNVLQNGCSPLTF